VSSLVLTQNQDWEIIRDYCETKSERSAVAFVRKHEKFVYSTAMRYLQDYDEANDATQEVFLKALGKLDKFRQDSSLKTWLYRITVNICINIQRKKKIRSIFKGGGYDDYLDYSSNDPNPLQKLESKELTLIFFKALGKLPPKQRETFALRYFDNMSYEEISNLVGTSVGGLKANYFQALKKLAAYLK
jgi:RNA polymerase sigma-70 factor, ECF subfamily